ncbi:MAG: NADH-ubiquinone oxidoreductase-F iron-sulfur binding region domain-containing protein [bacterium]|nr:NADH-ubiquinone oxidoreductase-F iron-sulfur binding region domain-containing protein [bacterium]
MENDIIAKIEKAGLVGRGGAEYPTAAKWQGVKKEAEEKKYVICNASEGELGLFKDLYILKHYPEQVVKGIILALDYLNVKDAFFNLNKKYYRQIKFKLMPIIKSYNQKGYNIQIFSEEPSYIGGEETALLDAIEGKRTEPRLKPPYPSSVGLFGKPTIINNVETLYNVACVNDGIFDNKRFCSLSGKIKNRGVYHLPADWSVEKILKETGNYPDFDFFVQIGGSASGPIYNKEQIKNQKMTGAGGLEVYDKKTEPQKIILRWLEFFQKESCGKCAPCRMGSFQLLNLVRSNKNIPWNELFEILEATKETSFCALGRAISEPIYSYYSNVLAKK